MTELENIGLNWNLQKYVYFDFDVGIIQHNPLKVVCSCHLSGFFEFLTSRNDT